MVLVAGLGGRVGKHNLATHTTLVACGLLGFQRSARPCGLQVAGALLTGALFDFATACNLSLPASPGGGSYVLAGLLLLAASDFLPGRAP